MKTIKLWYGFCDEKTKEVLAKFFKDLNAKNTLSPQTQELIENLVLTVLAMDFSAKQF